MSGRIRNVKPKPGYLFDGQSVFPRTAMRDGALANVMSGRGTSVDRSSHNMWLGQTMTPQQIEAAYRSSWLVRQIVDVPAQDMTRAGRDWDAEDEEIQKIEAEEKRLGYWAKVRQAIIYGRLGGGVIFINLGDDPSRPLPRTVQFEQIESLVALHRTQMTIGIMDDDLLSTSYGEPTVFRVNTRSMPIIHPSRLIIFKGQTVPGMHFSSWEDKFWGDSIVQTVNEAVKDATTATSGFASLIDEAKVDVFTMPGMYETLAQPGGEAKFMAALQAAATGKSIHRMLALGEGETWETRQLTWSGMPELIMCLMSIAAAAADIPATRLLSKSPDGMNATGAGDMANYAQMVGAKQEMDLRPALDRLDAVVLPSAGVTSDLTYTFSPLMVLTEEQQATIEAKEAETLTKIAATGLFPDTALAETFANRMVESQRFPGFKEARDKALAAGDDPNDPANQDDPSVLTQGGGDPVSQGGGQSGSGVPARLAANDAATWLADATPRPLYVQRKLLNATDVIAWAKDAGFASTLPAADMHVTVLYSRASVDPMKMGRDWSENEKGEIVVRPGGPRVIEKLGENAVVLRFTSPDLEWRHKAMIEAGGSHDWPEYQPHVTLSYAVPEGVDVEAVKPFAGELRFGPELFEALDLNWKQKVIEA